jgi:hypothetical protein
MENGEQLQDHFLVCLPFTRSFLPKRFAPCSMRYAAFYSCPRTTDTESIHCGKEQRLILLAVKE